MNILFSSNHTLADLLFDRQIKTFLVTIVLLKIVSRHMYRIAWVYQDTHRIVSNMYRPTPNENYTVKNIYCENNMCLYRILKLTIKSIK